MVVYALSPGAYDGLLKLAKDKQWCADYDRVLRYLDVVVSLQEAAKLENQRAPFTTADVSWKCLAVMEATDWLSIQHR